MGKKKKQNKRERISTDPADATSLKHNPFAALAAKSATSSPVGEVGEPETPTTADDEHVEPPGRAVVRKQRKGRGGKTVTVVSHLDLDPQALEQWCATLRKKLGCGGAVEADLVILQGDQRDRAAAMLESMGVGRVTVS